MSDGKTRVDFNAPESLVREADVVSDLLDTSRTTLLIEGLRKELDDVVSDEGFQRRLREAFYAGRVDVEAVATVLGTEEASRIKRLRESLDREPPTGDAEVVDFQSREEFYDGDVPAWTPGGRAGGDEDAGPERS